MVIKKKYMCLIPVFITLVIWVFAILNKIELLEEREKKERIWKTEFIERKIESISIIVNQEFYEIKGRRGLGWSGVQKVYINKLSISPDSLYRKYDFFHRVCEKYYFLSYESIGDSIVFKFPPIDRYEVYVLNNYSPYFTRTDCHPKWNLYDKKYLKYLPKCKE